LLNLSWQGCRLFYYEHPKRPKRHAYVFSENHFAAKVFKAWQERQHGAVFIEANYKGLRWIPEGKFWA
jgi:hypothetical protein